MRFGPIVWRELIVAARKPSTYAGRVGSVVVLLLVVGGLEAVAASFAWERSTIAGQHQFALRSFGALVVVLSLLAMMAVPGQVAPGIATEREKKSLDALLTTPLNGAEIVAGKFAAGMLRYATDLLAGVPFILAITFVWGIDVRLVLLTYAGLIATAFASGTLAVWASARARDARRAVGYSLLLLLAWGYLPFMSVFVLPRIWPRLGRWVAPVMSWFLDSGPVSVLMYLPGVMRRGSLAGTVGRMIAWEVSGGLILLAWTSWRFRAICRAAEDREGRRWLRKVRALSAARRPPCGDDPILWYEMYNTRGVGPIMRRVGQGIGAVFAVVFAVLICGSALPAFRELVAHGYGSLSSASERIQFNLVVRVVTGIINLVLPILIAGMAAESIAAERAKDTLPGLLTTPLTGPEILRSKVLGALWRLRVMLAILVGLWLLGLASGAVHPKGFAAAMLCQALTVWVCLALGTYGSIWSADLKQANGWVVLPVTLMAFSGFLPLMLPVGLTTILLGVASPAALSYLSLVSFENVHSATLGLPWTSLISVGIQSGEGAGAVVATCLIGWTIQVAAASVLTFLCLRDFDRAVGRPTRNTSRMGPSPQTVADTVNVPSEVSC